MSLARRLLWAQSRMETKNLKLTAWKQTTITLSKRWALCLCFQVILIFLFYNMSIIDVCLLFRSSYGSVACVITARRVVCSSRGCWRTWVPILWCWTCCRSPMRWWVRKETETKRLFVFLSYILSDNVSFHLFGSVFAQSDTKMNEIMTLAHTFLQNFCRGNPQNQVLLHKHLNLFLTPGVYWYDLLSSCWHALLFRDVLFSSTACSRITRISL